MRPFPLLLAPLVAVPALLILVVAGGTARAEAVVAAETIRAGSTITPDMLSLADVAAPGAIDDMRDAIGLEARVNLYQGRPIRPQDLGMPTVVERNERVSLVYEMGGLRITAEGRALDRAGAGEPVRVMNMASRSTVMGVAVQAGVVEVTR
jgi:flagella basal body P-ring formation protein FlgA